MVVNSNNENNTNRFILFRFQIGRPFQLPKNGSFFKKELWVGIQGSCTSFQSKKKTSSFHMFHESGSLKSTLIRAFIERSSSRRLSGAWPAQAGLRWAVPNSRDHSSLPGLHRHLVRPGAFLVNWFIMNRGIVISVYVYIYICTYIYMYTYTI